MKQIIYIVAIILSMSSCMKEELPGREEVDRSKGIRVYADVLSHTVVETRANSDESTIKDLTALVFDGEDNLTEAVRAAVFTNGEIYVNLQHTADPRRLVLMANVQEIIDNAKLTDDPFAPGATLGSITGRLLLHSGLIVDDAATGRNINTLPMLSEIIDEQKIDYNTTLGTADARLALTHRLTKISAESRVSTLQIETISLRHAPASGGKLLTFDNPADATPVIAERTNYFGADDAGAGAKFPSGNQPLYIFSSDNTPESETGGNTVEMILKAKYDTDAEATYYRIRLDKKANEAATTRTLFDLKPGKHYKIIFTKVASSGYPSLKEAIDNDYSNIEYDIVDDSDMGEILSNGQYMLNATNSDCKIYGDFDPAFEYPIADILTDAPTTAQIEITPIGGGFTVATAPGEIVRDGKTINRLKVKFDKQFSSGSLKLRVGNLTKIFTFSIELDPPYIKIDNVMGARIASGFEPRTIALSKSAYNERVKPTDLTDKLEGSATVYIHFNKITLGDEARIGEAYYTHKTNIHHTKVMVMQRPWVEVDEVQFSTGNIVLGWHPTYGTLRYKIGGAVEYGIIFQQSSYIAVNASRQPTEAFSTYYTPNPIQSKNAVITSTSQSNWNTYQNMLASTLKDSNDPCKALSTGSDKVWRMPTAAELDILIEHKGEIAGSHKQGLYNSAPNGILTLDDQIFAVANGRRWVYGDRSLTETMSEVWSSTTNSSLQSTPAYTVIYPYHVSNASWSIRCVHASDNSFFNVAHRQTITMADTDEEYYLPFTSNNPITATLSGDIVGKMNVTVTNVSPGVMTTGRITLTRTNVMHDGGTYSGILTLKDNKHSIHTSNVNIGMNSVNIGGTLVTNATGKYWSGGTQWATGNLILKNWTDLSGMSISKNPKEGGMFFKWMSDWGGYQKNGPFSDASGRSNASVGFHTWVNITLANSTTFDPCRSAAAVAGESGAYGGVRVWRYPSQQEIEKLQTASGQTVSGGIRSYQNGRLFINGENYLNVDGTFVTSNLGGIWGNAQYPNDQSYFYRPSTASAHVIHKGQGIYVRCVKSNTR